ncbi:NUDIX hydrolase 6-like protein [Tanacetum coccineum]
MSDELLGDDSKPRSYDVTILNYLFEFNDDFTLCNDNPLFDEKFEDISSLDHPKSAPLNCEPLGFPMIVKTSVLVFNPSITRSSDHEDENEHIEKVLEIVDLFHIPNITIDQVMLRAFPMSLTGAASRWLRNEPTGSITTWGGLKTKFLNKYCPPARTAKKMEEINNFQQEPDENLYQAWEQFKELLMKYPQHYLTEMQEVILFYNGLGIPIRHILDSRGAIPSKTAADAKVAIQEMAEYSQNGIMEHLVYAAQVRCEQGKGPHYTKDCPLKEEGKTLKEAYYTQFGEPFQGGGYIVATPGFYLRNNVNPLYQEQRQSMKDTISKFMSESAKRHEENSNLIKEIQASTDAAIQNQGASIKTLEIQIGQMSKVLQERGFGSLPSSTEANPRDQVKSISTTIEADSCPCEEKKGLYGPQFSETYSEASHINKSIPQKGKDPRSFTLPCFINNVCFDNALVDLGASMVYKGNSVIGSLMNVPIFVGNFSVVTDFAVLENMDEYRDEGIGDVIFGEPFLREVGIKTRRFEGMITIYNGNDEVTYQMVRSHPRFKHHTNEQCNKIPPLLKVSEEDKMNRISHPYQKLKGFYKGVLNLGPDYFRDVKMEEWLTSGHISVHEMK